MVLMKEMNVQEREWDVQKIALGFAALLVVIVIGLVLKGENVLKGQVAGVATSQKIAKPTLPIDPAPTIRAGVIDKIEDIKKEVSSLDLVEVANTSPQIQKVLNDIKNLQNLPHEQAKNACIKLCSSL